VTKQRPPAATPAVDAGSPPTGLDLAAASDAQVGTATTRPAVVPAETRGGEDTRRRGWFWHWNSIVTQYAPLLGLKGVGLLNSYTVWTDRREESPHRGYAFPSQQSEADFYGEDRAELITINKILVALDLIEIRKEMVLRVDPQGRRWRVPHNFYRVKDHADGFNLTGPAVLRVAALADQDKTVYRYVRRVFSPRFSPIDGDNVWHQILPELRQTPLWQRLAERALREEDRASARTRAGHAARRAPAADSPATSLSVPTNGDEPATFTSSNASSSVETPETAETSVASINRGLTFSVDDTNKGLPPVSATSVDSTNDGEATDVDPSNRTYNQSDLTTTNKDGAKTHEPGAGRRTPITGDSEAPHATTSHQSGHSGTVRDQQESPAAPVAQSPETGPGGWSPLLAEAEAATVRAFEEANARVASPAERNLLRGLADRFAVDLAEDPPATGSETPVLGWTRVATAIYEAVEAGSAFVAPRRVREILTRWERDGFPKDGEATPATPRGGTLAVDLLDAQPDVPLPHGHGGRRTWAFVVGRLGATIGRETLAELVTGTAIVGYREGEVTLAVPDATRAERIATTHRELIARKLSEAMRRPVRLVVLTTGGGDRSRRTGPRRHDDGPVTRPTQPRRDRAAETVTTLPVPSFVVAECGLASEQVWSAVLGEIVATNAVSAANFDAWLRATALIGREEMADGRVALVIGVPHALAQRRVGARYLAVLRGAVATVIGAPLAVRVVVSQEWLAESVASA